MTFPPEEKLKLKVEDVVWREVGDELVVLELSTSTYLTLNGTARHIWEALASGSTVDELVRAISDRYRVPIETARADVEAFLGDLEGRELLERAA